MRFESKHSYFKDLAHRVKCFKNIPYTMAERHQEAMCYHLNCAGECNPLVKNTMVGNSECFHSLSKRAVVRQMYVYGDLLKIGSLLRECIPFSN